MNRFVLVVAGIMGLVVSACSSAPTYPEPSGKDGQILVQLEGKPKAGTKKAATEGAGDEYSNRRVSIEQGQSFERVDYDAIDDVVVVILHSGLAAIRGKPLDEEVEVGAEAMSRSQLLMQPGGNFTVRNTRDTALTIVGVSLEDIFELKVGPNTSASIRVEKPGEYEITSDEDESLFAFMWVTLDAAWIGNSKDDAFFDNFPPGDYSVSVHAPRLPCWYRKIKVEAAKRVDLTAELTVNDMAGAGK
jgi:hypothetical protein